MKTTSIALTLGEPAGIGVDIFLQLAERIPETVIVIADKRLIKHRAQQLGIPYRLPDDRILHVDAATIDCCGNAVPENAAYVLRTLDIATQGCLQGEFAAMVTGPVHKATINAAGFPFTGHTEFLAKKAGVHRTVMCFQHPNLRMALATTHVPLHAVPSLVTEALLTDVILLIQRELQNLFHISHPRITVCGLNPHAGEEGHLGDEEQRIIAPTLAALRKQHVNVSGPYAADTIFLHDPADCIVSLYHDQLLPALKMNHFFDTVNITLGLPFIRTSVDHGTALELAGTGKANPNSLLHALHLAQELAACT